MPHLPKCQLIGQLLVVLQEDQRTIRRVIWGLMLLLFAEAVPRLLPAVSLAVGPLGTVLLGLSMRSRSVASNAVTLVVPAVSAILSTSGASITRTLDAHPVDNFLFLADVLLWHPHFGLAVACWVAAIAGKAEPLTLMKTCLHATLLRVVGC